jgi:ribosomal protein S6
MEHGGEVRSIKSWGTLPLPEKMRRHKVNHTYGECVPPACLLLADELGHSEGGAGRRSAFERGLYLLSRSLRPSRDRATQIGFTLSPSSELQRLTRSPFCSRPRPPPPRRAATTPDLDLDLRLLRAPLPSTSPFGSYYVMTFDCSPVTLKSLDVAYGKDPRVVRWTNIKLGESCVLPVLSFSVTPCRRPGRAAPGSLLVARMAQDLSLLSTTRGQSAWTSLALLDGLTQP